MATFEELLAEGEREPADGWDFSWFAGRATEERPPWGYARLLAARVASAGAVLDVQTGGGEVFAGALGQSGHPPPLVAATESWPPNAALAAAALRPFGGHVVRAADGGGLPFAGGTFHLVVSRHPTVVGWAETARVLRPGGRYFSQQVGAGSNQELIDFMMGTQPVNPARDPDRAVAGARAAGLEVVDLRRAALRAEFFDVGAVVYFLRKVFWTVPGFTVAGYRDRLAALHDHMTRHGLFRTTVHRFLIEATRPA